MKKTQVAAIKRIMKTKTNDWNKFAYIDNQVDKIYITDSYEMVVLAGLPKEERVMLQESDFMRFPELSENLEKSLLCLFHNFNDSFDKFYGADSRITTTTREVVERHRAMKREQEKITENKGIFYNMGYLRTVCEALGALKVDIFFPRLLENQTFSNQPIIICDKTNDNKGMVMPIRMK